MLSAAAPQAALRPCFGTAEHVIRLEEREKKEKTKSGSQSERGGSAIGVRMTSLSGRPLLSLRSSHPSCYSSSSEEARHNIADRQKK